MTYVIVNQGFEVKSQKQKKSFKKVQFFNLDTLPLTFGFLAPGLVQGKATSSNRGEPHLTPLVWATPSILGCVQRGPFGSIIFFCIDSYLTPSLKLR